MGVRPINNCCEEIKGELREIKEAIESVASAIQQGDGPTLCTATGVVGTSTAGNTQVNIPPNACITKIYASSRPGTGTITFGEVSVIKNTLSPGATIFLQNFFGSDNRGNFETTMVQPLCVGPDGAIAHLSTDSGTQIVSLTVLYCPDCCAPAQS